MQSVDTGLVSKQAITNATEDLMLGTPRYWLTPSLIALASWINNNKPLAEKALNEGLTRHELKTILIFTLICNRIKRRDASFMWLSKYFEHQNPLEMPQETLILVNAYTDGVFGPDSQGECMVQMQKWMEYLSNNPDVVQELEDNWKARINVLPIDSTDNAVQYQYLPKYSDSYSSLMNLLHKALRNQSFRDYLEGILHAKKENKDYTTELDDILYKLVEEYDSDEFELRKKHKLCELILKHEGDKDLAEQEFEATVISLFKDKVTFFDILVHAVTKDNASPSMRKLAVMLMKEWIINAYDDYVAEYRNSYPENISIKLNKWSATTVDGSDVTDLTDSYKLYLQKLLDKALSENHVSYLLIAGLIGCVWWMCAAYNDAALIVTILCVASILGNFYFVNKTRTELKEKFVKDCKAGANIIESTCAEYTDWQKEYKNADKVAEEVVEYLKEYNAQDFTENSANNKILDFKGDVE